MTDLRETAAGLLPILFAVVSTLGIAQGVLAQADSACISTSIPAGTPELSNLARTAVVASNQIGRGASLFDDRLVSLIPTEGPNCYFAAITVNSLLKVPAMTLSEKEAALLFLNPALCNPVTDPQFGDIGLDEQMGEIGHVFTVISNTRKFEKAGPSASDKFAYVDVPSISASRFVACKSMQSWVDNAIRTLPAEFQVMNEQLTHLEATLDVRNGPKSFSKYSQIKIHLEECESYEKRLFESLSTTLRARGILKVPYAGMLNGDYFRFAKEYPQALAEPQVFALLWVSARLASAKEKFIYYNLHSAQQK